MIELKEQKELLELMGKELKRKAECILIGGSAMLFYEFGKTVTKDMDILFADERGLKELENALRKAGFRTIRKGDFSRGHPVQMELGNKKLDLFCGRVFKARLSPGIRKRLRERIEFGNLMVSLISPEDIILLKSATDREGDRLDAAEIIKGINIDWDSLIEETEWQAGNSSISFPITLFDFLEEIDDQKLAEIPRDVKKRVTSMYRRELEKLERSRGRRRGH